MSGLIPTSLPEMHIWKPKYFNVCPDVLERIVWVCHQCGNETRSKRAPFARDGSVILTYELYGKECLQLSRVDKEAVSSISSIFDIIDQFKHSYNAHFGGKDLSLSSMDEPLSSDCQVALIQRIMVS
ncbi:MAG TPA: hypothetical protein VIE65_02870 [Methylobacter sp.]|jgi:hypothetical protein